MVENKNTQLSLNSRAYENSARTLSEGMLPMKREERDLYE
jgi:hypothetical protein